MIWMSGGTLYGGQGMFVSTVYQLECFMQTGESHTYLDFYPYGDVGVMLQSFNEPCLSESSQSVSTVLTSFSWLKFSMLRNTRACCGHLNAEPLPLLLIIFLLLISSNLELLVLLGLLVFLGLCSGALTLV